MIQVTPSFTIQAPGINFSTAQLFAEAGPSGVSLVVLDSENCFKALVSYSFAAGLTEKELADKLNAITSNEDLLQQSYHRAHIFWSFTDSILVPAELMNEDHNANMLNLVFGDASQGIIRSDFLYKHNLHNVYRIPVFAVDQFSACLPLATQTHVFTPMANIDLPGGDHMYCIFYSNSITIMLGREGKLQVIQNFIYNEPGDCVFHLLNVCKGFDVKPDAVMLHINGMVDERSALYAAIYKYFMHPHFDELPKAYTYDPALTEYPPHFFCHLYSLASCV